MAGLPLDGVFAAHLRADARTREQAAGQEPPAWRTYFGRSPLWDIVADLYDLTHQIAAGKKPVTPYPRDPQAAPRVLAIDELTDDMWG